MRIGYDGKRAVQNFTGLGNYSRYVVQSLSAFAPENEYWLYAPVHRENQQLSSMVAESRGTVSVHYPSYWLWRGMTSLWRVGGIRRTLKRDNIQLFHGLSNELPDHPSGTGSKECGDCSRPYFPETFTLFFVGRPLDL